MTNNENQYTIYIRSTKESIPCTKEEFDNYYRDINAYRKKQQRHGRCVCPESRRLHCDMDCMTCPFHRAGDQLSLDYTTTDDDGNEKSWVESLADPLTAVDTSIEEAELHEALRSLLTTLDADDLAICKTIMGNLSERAAASALNLSRNTYTYRRNKVLERMKNSLKKFL